jgi:hypothetical protein
VSSVLVVFIVIALLSALAMILKYCASDRWSRSHFFLYH